MVTVSLSPTAFLTRNIYQEMFSQTDTQLCPQLYNLCLGDGGGNSTCVNLSSTDFFIDPFTSTLYVRKTITMTYTGKLVEIDVGCINQYQTGICFSGSITPSDITVGQNINVEVKINLNFLRLNVQGIANADMEISALKSDILYILSQQRGNRYIRLARFSIRDKNNNILYIGDTYNDPLSGVSRASYQPDKYVSVRLIEFQNSQGITEIIFTLDRDVNITPFQTFVFEVKGE
jgi:hypothetical protein